MRQRDSTRSGQYFWIHDRYYSDAAKSNSHGKQKITTYQITSSPNWVCCRAVTCLGSIPGGNLVPSYGFIIRAAGRGSSWADRPCRVAGRATPAAPAARRRSGAYCGGSNSTVAPREVDDSCNSNMPPGGVSAGTSNDNPTGTVAPGLTLVSNISVNSVAAGSAS